MKLYINFALCILFGNSFLHSSTVPSTQNSPRPKIRLKARRTKTKNYITPVEEQVYTNRFEEEQHTNFCKELETQNIDKNSLQLLSQENFRKIGERAYNEIAEKKQNPSAGKYCLPHPSEGKYSLPMPMPQLSDSITLPRHQQKEKELKNTELKTVASPQKPTPQKTTKKNKSNFIIEKVVEHGQDSRVILDTIIDVFTNSQTPKCTGREIQQCKKLLYEHYDVSPKTPAALNDKLGSLCYDQRTQSIAGILENTYAYYYNIHCNQTKIIPFNANNIEIKNNKNSTSSQTTLDENYTIEVLDSHDLQQPKYTEQHIPELTEIVSHNKKIHQDIRATQDDDVTHPFLEIIYDKVENKNYTIIEDTRVFQQSRNELLTICGIKQEDVTMLLNYLETREINTIEPLPNGYVILYDKATPYQLTVALIDLRDDHSSDPNTASVDYSTDEAYSTSESNAPKSESSASTDESDCVEQQTPELTQIISYNQAIHTYIKSSTGFGKNHILVNQFLGTIYDEIKNENYQEITTKHAWKTSLNELYEVYNINEKNIHALLNHLNTTKIHHMRLLSNGYVALYNKATSNRLIIALVDLRNKIFMLQ